MATIVAQRRDSWVGIDVFLAVAETRSFTKAASKLGVSLSYVSRRISALETDLDTRLLVRTTRNVELTEAGRNFQDNCTRLVDNRDAILSAASSQFRQVSGPLRVTCSAAFGEHVIIPLLTEFATTYPDVRLEILATNELVDLVGDGFDVAIRTGEPDNERLTYAPLSSRRLHICAAPAYIAQHGRPMDLEDLKQHQCLIGSLEHWSFRERGRSRRIKMRGKFRCNNGFGLVDAALKGLGICQLPDFYVNKAIGSGALEELLPAYEPKHEQIWAVYPKRTQNMPRLQALINVLQSGLSKYQSRFS